MHSPNLAGLIKVARALGPLRDEVVFVGGAVVELLVTDPGAEKIRPTDDVDVVIGARTHTAYYSVEERLRELGFTNDPDGPICRWRVGGLRVDVMPVERKILGFSNRWYASTLHTAQVRAVAPDLKIRLITAPCFLATKLVAFHNRGRNDFLASPDIEDLIAVIDGREEIMAEVFAAEPILRDWLRSEFKQLLGTPDFLDAVPRHLPQDATQPDRAQIVRERLQALSGVVAGGGREKTIHRVVKGHLTVVRELAINGIAKGTVNVIRGGALDLNGICTGDLIVHPGAAVVIRGTVAGDVLNRGGNLIVYGIITGRLTTFSGKTVVDPKAKIAKS